MAFGRKKEDVFFTLFKDFSKSLLKAGDAFEKFLGDFPNFMEAEANGLKSIESECDSKKHAIIDELNNSFVTPFDREDIFTLAEQLDDLVDFMEDLASKFIIYNVQELPQAAKEMGGLMVEAIKQVEILIQVMPDSHKRGECTKAIIALNDIEDRGDMIYRDSLHKLFHEKNDTLEILKWKDLYEELENAVDAYEHLADTVEGILTKNA